MAVSPHWEIKSSWWKIRDFAPRPRAVFPSHISYAKVVGVGIMESLELEGTRGVQGKMNKQSMAVPPTSCFPGSCREALEHAKLLGP